MRIFLYGISALSYWLSAPSGTKPANHAGQKALRDCAPTNISIAYLEKRCPQIPQPYHLLTAKKTGNPPSAAITHRYTFQLSGQPFCRIASGIYAPCPELCFVQIARDLPLHELIKVGDALCGAFYIDPRARNGLGARRPLTSTRLIAAFIARNPGITGAKKARKAVGLMVDKAASPPEIFLAMALGLPHRYGGYQLPGIAVNQRIKPGRKARAIAKRNTLVPDLLCASARVAIEYDSNTEHASPAQLTRDAQKRLALEEIGYKVITVTAQQIRRPDELRRIADQTRRRAGNRLRPQSAKFLERNNALLRTGFSLERYHRREWLSGEVSATEGETEAVEDRR